MTKPWHPIDNKTDLKTLGKFGEELGECSAAVSRCIIQGLDEKEPTTGKLNRDWLAEEIADVVANLELVMERFDVPYPEFLARIERKKAKLREWHGMA